MAHRCVSLCVLLVTLLISVSAQGTQSQQNVDESRADGPRRMTCICTDTPNGDQCDCQHKLQDRAEGTTVRCKCPEATYSGEERECMCEEAPPAPTNGETMFDQNIGPPPVPGGYARDIDPPPGMGGYVSAVAPQAPARLESAPMPHYKPPTTLPEPKYPPQPAPFQHAPQYPNPPLPGETKNFKPAIPLPGTYEVEDPSKSTPSLPGASSLPVNVGTVPDVRPPAVPVEVARVQPRQGNNPTV